MGVYPGYKDTSYTPTEGFIAVFRDYRGEMVYVQQKKVYEIHLRLPEASVQDARYL